MTSESVTSSVDFLLLSFLSRMSSPLMNGIAKAGAGESRGFVQATSGTGVGVFPHGCGVDFVGRSSGVGRLGRSLSALIGGSCRVL